ncbi:flagellar hook-basal body complex protein FliE [Pseudoxanthomonas sp. GM95]|uniref:flagellar hook-basal body complex protein FliE n=1 Tax=Pseudoxanthomonas sp. GM95 TaxID=1881043 RepID=UPI0008D46AEA|nr:flagellar hook-basal body complex protein FliE [Pseudoxanthomonas sp. GM95]SEK50757.1 flagellar hook-basal body complex protein FliE [Pseudoxanthomonas sp. GM95]
MTDAISSILSQIRAHESRTREGVSNAIDVGGFGNVGNVGRSNETTPSNGAGFGQLLSKAIDNVSETQANASSLQTAFELGDPRADLARTMVAMQQSQIAFRATVEVRNRLVQAYQDVMNMPV